MSTANIYQHRLVFARERLAPRIRNYARGIALAIVWSVISVSAAFAADSVCMLGDNGKIGLTTFEHRSATGDGRVTEVTLIFGMHLLRGRLVDTNSGAIILKEAGSSKESYTFRGTIGVNYQTKKMTVKGKIKADNLEISSISSTFPGKELNP
jgi:hypothetical protein